MMAQKILTQKLFPKFRLIQILCLQVTHDYVHWHCSIDFCVKSFLVDETLCENCFYFSLKLFLLNSVGEMCFWRRATNIVFVLIAAHAPISAHLSYFEGINHNIHVINHLPTRICSLILHTRFNMTGII